MSSCGENEQLREEKMHNRHKGEGDINGFAEVELTTDMHRFSHKEKQMLRYLCSAAEIMDDIFWKEALPGIDRDEFLESIKDEKLRKFAIINYGPWDRLNGNEAFIDGFGAKPAGSGFYPADITKEEMEAFDDPNKMSQYHMITREADGSLKTIPYNQYFKKEVNKAADYLEKAAKLSESESFAKYLYLRAAALRTDDYFASDMAWMDVKDSKFDFVVGPIENYEDAFEGTRTAHESFLLIKDEEWSQKLDKFAALLPQLQKELPVQDEYKAETPGAESDMNVYEVILYMGDCNAGSKTIAINLPNDERVHLEKGTRKLQLKNAMEAKFNKIMLPISKVVINPEQLNNVKFSSFFENVTFHEVAHGMGIKNVVGEEGKTVRNALQETYSTIEEAKADIMGLYLVDQLRQKGEITEDEVESNYITFFAGIFRSVRFGIASAHGRANMLCFNFLAKNGAFSRSQEGIYTVDVEKMRLASIELLQKILKIQGDGDYASAAEWIREESFVGDELSEDLNRIASADIPKDIYYHQGKRVLGLGLKN